MVWKTRKKIRKTIRNATEKKLAPLRPLKYFTGTFLKGFHCPKFAKKIKDVFTARLCRGGHANISAGRIHHVVRSFLANKCQEERQNLSYHMTSFRVRQRNGEGVVRRNGCPKGCFWRVCFYSAPLGFFLLKPLKTLMGQRRNGLFKPFWTTVSPHDAFSAPLACPQSWNLPSKPALLISRGVNISSQIAARTLKKP